MKAETETLKNLFRAYAAEVEKVANEILEPSTLTRVQVPPEVIDYWLSHIESIMEVDAKSLLGNNDFTPSELVRLRAKYGEYCIQYNKWHPNDGNPLSFDAWWRNAADEDKNMQKDAWEDSDFNESKINHHN